MDSEAFVVQMQLLSVVHAVYVASQLDHLGSVAALVKLRQVATLGNQSIGITDLLINAGQIFCSSCSNSRNDLNHNRQNVVSLYL